MELSFALKLVEIATMRRQFSRCLRPLVLMLALAALAAPAAAELPYSQGRLWLVEAPGVAPSWVLGTMHSADPEIATPWPALADVMNNADSITIELVLDEAATASMGQAMMLSDGRSLAQIVGRERMTKIVKTGAQYGMPVEALQQFKPWAVSMIFSLPPSELERQATGAPMLDAVLQQHGNSRGIPVYGIETVEEQMSLFTGDSEADQIAFLDATLEMQPQAEAQFDEMRRLWLAGDLAGLHDLSMEAAQSAPPGMAEDFMNRLIRDRNRRMAIRVGRQLAQGNALIAVGALHLPGEEGVLALLAKRGYAVSAVK